MHAEPKIALPLLAVLLMLPLSACVTSKETAPANLDHAAPRHSRPTAAWALAPKAARAVEAGTGEHPLTPLGYLVRFESLDEPERYFFSVRNAWQQELGLIDHVGRAYRFQPHGREAEWVGSGTVEVGARILLSAPESAVLHEIELSELR